jgi:lipoyl(octanoyl) transferase
MKIEVKNSVKPIDYIKSMKILEKRVNDVFLGKKKELVWILEHRAVYTGGTSSKITDLLNKKIKIVKTGRGGKYTYHGPGQKVVYFVLNLNERGKDIRKLLNQVERCIISILDDYRIESFADKKNIGIWVKNEKIAAIGIKVKKWVAYHGFALNVSTDISKYKGIIPCGIKGKKITSLKKLGISNHKDIHRIISKNFLNTFL